ncbi:unnamed protein product [Calypogeia fissa]
MASLAVSASAVLRGSPLTSSPTRTQSVTEAQEIRSPQSMASFLNRLVCSVANGRSLRPISASARQIHERNGRTAAKNTMNGACPCAFVDSEITALPAALESTGTSIEERCHDLLKRSELPDLSAREAFIISEDITEANMERLVQSLVQEEGQSMEDYRQRAIMFAKIAEFFSQRKAYSAEEEKSWTGADVARTMQAMVDVVLAEEGRSAKDYSYRAQLFRKSAEVFPFMADSLSS